MRDASFSVGAITLSNDASLQIEFSKITSGTNGIVATQSDAIIVASQINWVIRDDGVVNLGGGSVNATYNWWGNASGPHHPTDNPDGEGDWGERRS